MLRAALKEAGGLRPGETVLVTAAAGGTGQFAVQLAKLAGCHVVRSWVEQARGCASLGEGGGHAGMCVHVEGVNSVDVDGVRPYLACLSRS